MFSDWFGMFAEDDAVWMIGRWQKVISNQQLVIQ